jgi:hypothetical protein
MLISFENKDSYVTRRGYSEGIPPRGRGGIDDI